VEYLRRSTQKSIGMAVGMPTVQELLDPRYYAALPGGLLEALGRLFAGPVRLYVYPRKEANDQLITTENIPVPDDMRHLLAHLWANHLIEDLQGVNFSNLDIKYVDLLKKIRLAVGTRWEGSGWDEGGYVENRGLRLIKSAVLGGGLRRRRRLRMRLTRVALVVTLTQGEVERTTLSFAEIFVRLVSLGEDGECEGCSCVLGRCCCFSLSASESNG
jgi:hypothetical protein